MSPFRIIAFAGIVGKNTAKVGAKIADKKSMPLAY
jgi:hypothetical protein